MATIEDCMINRSVTVTIGEQSREGTIVGRRHSNKIEGYVAPINNIHPANEQGDDMVQIAFPTESATPAGEWVTTGLLCKPDRVNLKP